MWIDVRHTLISAKNRNVHRNIGDDKLFSSTLKAYETEHPNAKVDHAPFLDGLKENFEKRFGDSNLGKIVLAGLVNPYSIQNCLDFARRAQTVFEWVDVTAISSEMIDLQEHIGGPARHITDISEFWHKVTKMPATKKLASTILCMFGSTYMCESGHELKHEHEHHKELVHKYIN